MTVLARLVLIETSGNQAYIFETNKRRENVGASQLVHELGSTWVPDALRELGAAGGRVDEGRVDEGRPEVIVASSGKALVAVPAGGLGEDLVAAVTERSLVLAPGLDVCGVVSDAFAWGDSSGLAGASQQVHHQFQDVRAKRPGPALRALRLPIVAPCSSTGMSASVALKAAPGEDPADLSAASAAKWDAWDRGLARLAQLAGTQRDRLREVVGYLGDLAQWVAVVHADGNGLGAVFGDFQKALPEPQRTSDRAYADGLRQFSMAVDTTAAQALRTAITTVEMPGRVLRSGLATKPVLPLVVGGDDITFLCDGQMALQLTVELLRNFEHLSASSATVTMALDSAGAPVSRLGACAGMVFVKPHYPFSSAYDLCEELTADTKRQTKHALTAAGRRVVACSALDFHIVYDSGAVGLQPVRQQLTQENGGRATTLFAKPYVVTPLKDLGAASPGGQAWAERHSWEGLCRRAQVLQAEDDDGGEPRRRLPNSQAHALRNAMHAGEAVAEARFSQLLDRRPSAGLATLGDPRSGTLYWDDPTGREGVGPVTRRSAFLDAMEVSGFVSAGELKNYLGQIAQ